VKLALHLENSAKGRERKLNKCYTSLYMFKGIYECMNMVIIGLVNIYDWIEDMFYVQHMVYDSYEDMFYVEMFYVEHMSKEIILLMIIIFIWQALHMIVMFI